MAAIKFASNELYRMNSSYTPFEYGLNDAVCRVVWSIVLCYIIFACFHGSGGPVNWFLSHPFWQPANRLCFAIFIVHPMILTITLGTIQTPQVINGLTLFSITVVNLVLTFFAAFLITIAFDSPVINVEKLILGQNVKITLPRIQKSNGIKQILHGLPSEKIEKKRS